MHLGIDFAAADGTPIYAVEDGVVDYIGAARGFGQWIVLRHPSGESTVYGHMWDAFATGLKVGSKVAGGQLIAYVGENGQSTGPHLHFEVHPGRWAAGSQLDPAPWLKGALDPGSRTETPVGQIYSGRMTWLYDVLRAELGTDRVKALPGWETRGHGDFKDCRGVMLHHTGNSRETADSIARGRPDLPGPLSNLHIAKDGTVTVVAAGVCWHAGAGSLPWVPTNMGNWYLLGFECAWPDVVNGRYDEKQRWPDAQVIAMRDAAAACLGHLRYLQDRLTMHKTYAGRAQGKWDPGNMDLGWMQGEVRKDLDGYVFPGERPEGASLPPATPLPAQNPVITPPGAWADVLLFRGNPNQSAAQVAELQRRLKAAYANTHGKLVGEIDGIFGPNTERAVISFQRAAKLDPDGIVGPLTAAALNLRIVD